MQWVLFKILRIGAFLMHDNPLTSSLLKGTKWKSVLLQVYQKGSQTLMLYSKILNWELGSYFNQWAYFMSVKDSIFRTGQAVSSLHL